MIENNFIYFYLLLALLAVPFIVVAFITWGTDEPTPKRPHKRGQ